MALSAKQVRAVALRGEGAQATVARWGAFRCTAMLAGRQAGARGSWASALERLGPEQATAAPARSMARTEESARCVTRPDVSSQRIVARKGSRNGKHEPPGT
jgi:hypothetical protein